MRPTLVDVVRSSMFAGLKTLGHRLGLEIKHRRNELDEENVLRQLLAEWPFDLVVDVGANEGQYALALRKCGYRGAIVSFEPLPQAHAELLAKSRLDDAWLVMPPVAVGADAGEVVLNIAANSASSSVLPMLQRHLAAAPHSAYVGSMVVPLVRLDATLPGVVRPWKLALLKIDTQGYEDRVLAGAADLLPRLAAVQVEISLAKLYDGQARGVELISLLASAGFQLAHIIPGLRDPSDGRLLQFDGIFVRERSSTTD